MYDLAGALGEKTSDPATTPNGSTDATPMVGMANEPAPDGREGGGDSMDALTGALDTEISDPAGSSDEMAEIDALLGATMDSNTAQGGATSEPETGAGERPTAPMESDHEDETEAEAERGPVETDTA